MNIGIKEYCKFLDVNIGDIGISKVNLNPSLVNLHFSIPLYSTDLRKGGINLGLNFSLSNIDEVSDFGKGFKLNLFNKITNHSTNMVTCNLKDSFSATKVYDEGVFDEETGMIFMMIHNTDGHCKFIDLSGTEYFYEIAIDHMGFDYPDRIKTRDNFETTIKKVAGNIHINGMETAILYIENNRVFKIEVIEDNIVKTNIELEYSNQGYIESIKFYNSKNKIIKQLDLNFDIINKIITLSDVKNNVSINYHFEDICRVKKIEAFKKSKQIYYYDISYRLDFKPKYSRVSDAKDIVQYTHFHGIFPIYDLDSRGRVRGYKFNHNKKLEKITELNYNSYEASSVYNLIKNGYFLNGTLDWSLHQIGNAITIDEVDFLPPFRTTLGNNCILVDSETSQNMSSIYQSVIKDFKKDDVISFVLWAKNLSSYTNNEKPYINFKFYKKQTQIHEEKAYLVNYKTSYDLWEYHWSSFTLLDDYDKIVIEIVTPDYVKYKYAGIQLYNRNISTQINYNNKGLIQSILRGSELKTYDYDNLNKLKQIYESQVYNKKQVYNDIGLLIQEREGNLVTEYNYDQKNKVNSIINKNENKFISQSVLYDQPTIDVGILKDIITTSRNEELTNYFEKDTKNLVKQVDEKNNIVNYSYDDYDNIESLQTLDNNEINSINYQYKENRIIDKLISGNGSNALFIYDSADRLLSVNQEFNNGASRYNDITYKYLSYLEDEIGSKKYGSNGDEYLFDYDQHYRLKKIFLKPRFASQQTKLKCEYFYDALDRLERLEEYVDDLKIVKYFMYNEQNQLINIIKEIDDIIVNKNTLELTEKGTIINELYEEDSFSYLQQYDRDDKPTANRVQIYCEDFKYKDSKVLSCFFDEEEYDSNSQSIVVKKDLSSYEVSEDFIFKKNIASPVQGMGLQVNNEGAFNSLNLLSSNDSLSYRFFFAPEIEPEYDKTILFWFYYTPLFLNDNKCIVSIGDYEHSSHLGVYINPNRTIKLRIKHNNLEDTKTTEETLKQGWNFFALRIISKKGNPIYSKYELYFNDEIKSILKIGADLLTLNYNSLINIGFETQNSIEANKALGRIAPLIITDDSHEVDILSYRDSIYRNFIMASKGDLLDEIQGTNLLSSSLIVKPSEDFDYINLNNTLNSIKGLKPYKFKTKDDTVDYIYSINKETKRDAYNAYGNILAYKFGISTKATITMRCYLERPSSDKQYILECYDEQTESMSLYKDISGSIILKIGSLIFNTPINLPFEEWALISLSWKTINLNELGYRLNIVLRCNDEIYYNSLELSYEFKNLISYIGISKEEDYPLLGQIEMMNYSSSFVDVESNNGYLDGAEILSSVNEFDSFGLIKKSGISKYGKDIITNEYLYKKDNNRVIPDLERYRISYNENQTIKDYNYVYEKNGNIKTIKVNNQVVNIYEYDSINRLIEESNNGISPTNILYTYDNNGNIKTKESNNYSYEFNYHYYIKDRLLSVKKDNDLKTIEYYDTLYSNPTFYGRVINQEDKNGIFYTWEGRRLINFYDNISKINVEYKYDSRNRRIAKVITNKNNSVILSSIDYIYSEDKLISEKDYINNDEKHYLYNQNNQLISIIYNGHSYYYVRELTGNIIGLIDEYGIMVVEYEYDAYGCLLSSIGLLKDTLGKANPFIYKGYYYDSETSMYYCRTRYYIPEWCRWLNADDVSYLDPSSVNGLNLYAYCLNNPIMYADPSGCFAITTFLIGIGIAALIGAGVGAVAYTASEIVSYAITGDWSWSWGMFAGSVAGGAIGGAFSMIPGVGIMTSAFVTGFASSAIGMSLQNSWGGTDYSFMQIMGTSLLVGGVSAVTAGIMDNIRIPGLNYGRGSFQQVSNQIRTKFWNGTIRRVTGKTVAKMSTLVLYQTSLGAMVNGLFDAFDWNDKFASLIHW